MKTLDTIKKILRQILSTKAAAIYILLFATAIGIATFIENDFGSSAVRKIIFKSHWFELLLVLFALTLLRNISTSRIIQQKKWASLILHLAIITILIGAGITRYFSFDGTLHIREGNTTNVCLSSENYLHFKVVTNEQNWEFDERVLFASIGNNHFDQSYTVGSNLIRIKLKEFIPNPIQTFVPSASGKPTLKIVFGSTEYFVKEGQSLRIHGLVFNFAENLIPGAFNIIKKADSLCFLSENVYTQKSMDTQKTDTLIPSQNPYPLLLRAQYADSENSFMVADYFSGGQLSVVSGDRKIESESIVELRCELTINGKLSEQSVYGQSGLQGIPITVEENHLKLSVSYGAKPVILPFKITLKDFSIDRYPSTNSASFFASEVQVIDERSNATMNFKIFMNNFLQYDRYRFLQSTFDMDEKGTYFIVTHDYWGTWVSYIGYGLLTLSFVLTFLNRKSRFNQLSRKILLMRASRSFYILLLLALSIVSPAQPEIKPKDPPLSIEHAKLFSYLVMQDVNGRMKPMHTLDREILRKISGKESYDDLNADQVVLGIYSSNQAWDTIPLIKLGSHTRLLLNTELKRASFKDFFNSDGSYKIKQEVNAAYHTKPMDRGTLEIELLRVDERVNLLASILNGTAISTFPLNDDTMNVWTGAPERDYRVKELSYSNQMAGSFSVMYQSALHQAAFCKDYTLPDRLISDLKDFQRQKSAAILPTAPKIEVEIIFNNLRIFGRLASWYLYIGLLLLLILFLTIVDHTLRFTISYNLLLTGVIFGFLFHSAGLILRWYISGNAPWTNGYESLIYIAWATTLAGLLFARNSIGGMGATMVLTAIILWIAKLSYLDPEIIPLIPALNSKWLIIHVSIIAGSYGFLLLGAILGFINLLLMLLLKEYNKKRIMAIITELSYLSERALMGGIALLSIGTYLGGVWANESWGRYWGWDAKESWALITILVYAFILQLHLIPKLSGLFSYNVAALFGLSSVIMTYCGVNYYLSGLHSFAAGDPMPVPAWVYIILAGLIMTSIGAYQRKKKLNI